MARGQTVPTNVAIRRVYVPFVDEELERIDDWGFANRIRERAETLRRLVLKGLEAEAAKRQEAKAGSHS